MSCNKLFAFDPDQYEKEIKVCYVLFLVFFCVMSMTLLLISSQRGASGALIVSDGKAYYAWARSAVIDGDLDFSNDYRLLYPPDPLPPEVYLTTPKGLVVNKYPIGLALLELPGLIVGHNLAAVFGQDRNGVGPLYQYSVTFTLVVFYTFSFYLLFLGMQHRGVSVHVAALFAGAALVCTNVIHYVAKEPAMAHAAGLALFNIALWLIAGWKPSWRDVPCKSRIILGVLLGLMLLVRNTNVLLLFIIISLIIDKRRFSLRELLPVIATMTATAMLHPLSIYALWGEWMPTGYTQEGFTSGVHGVLSTLFSNRHGLFVYHPWYLFLIICNCFGLSRRESGVLSTSALLSFLLLVGVNGTWWCWWFGDSFGNRGFIELVGPLTISAGVSWGQKSTRKRPQALAFLPASALVCGMLNLYLWIGYLLEAYPHDGSHSVLEAYGWAFRRGP